MARLRFGLWRRLRGRQKLRVKKIGHMAEFNNFENILVADDETLVSKCENRFIADEESVVPDPEEDFIENISQISKSAVLVMEKEDLLPGLPNEVVIDFILTELPWTTLYIVSSLNHAWKDVCRNGEVHEARVRTGKVENLVVMTHSYPYPNDRIFQGVSLYDPAKDAWHLLPPLPRVKGGITSKYECAIVNGKVYVIGGLTIDCAAVSWKAVLMLDLGACRGVWTQCTNMKISRSQFACQVKDNKIYVFGGVDEEDHMLDEAHVYDPAKNAWSDVTSMGYKHSSHKAIRLDEFFYLCGGSIGGDELIGEFCDPDKANADQRAIIHQQVWNRKRAQDATFTEVYDSSKDEWLTVENFTQGRNSGSYFVVDGCLHHLTGKGVEVYDKNSNSWESFRLDPWSHAGESKVCAAEVVNEEIFALVLERRDTVVPPRENWALVARCNIVAVPVKASWSGLKINNLTWERVKCPHDFNWSSCSIHRLQL